MISSCIKFSLGLAKKAIKLVEKINNKLQSPTVFLFTNNLHKRLVYLKYDLKRIGTIDEV
jgi:hypothetical protein